MKLILRFMVTVALTGPVFFGLSRIDPLARWVGSDSAWSALGPLFRLFSTVGVEGEETVLFSMLLMLSFVIAAVLVWTAGAILAHRIAKRTPTR